MPEPATRALPAITVVQFALILALGWFCFDLDARLAANPETGPVAQPRDTERLDELDRKIAEMSQSLPVLVESIDEEESPTARATVVDGALEARLAGLEQAVEHLQRALAQIASERNMPGGVATVDGGSRAADEPPPQPKNRPIVDAAKDGDLARVQQLLAAGADIHVTDGDSRTAILAAFKAGHEQLGLDLLDLGARHTDEDGNGDTPLFWAVAKGHERAVRRLLEVGADENHRNHGKRTALMRAVESGRTDMVRVLLDHGVDVNARDEQGDTARSLAEEAGRTRLVDLLESYGAR